MRTVNINVDSSTMLGTWRGMGGAITEASAYNFTKLKPGRQKALLNAYYDEDGLDYRWGRVAVGSCDFSLSEHEYDLAQDKKFILPLLKKILAKKDLELIASPWSPPAFMKTNQQLRKGGRLRWKYYEEYAQYLKKWLDDYAEEGVEIDYLVPQNEPAAAQKWESCRWSLGAQRRFIYRYLAPALKESKTRILAWDHNKKYLGRVARLLMGWAPHEMRDKVAGLAFHWYDGAYSKQMDKVRMRYPDKILVSSEMCCGWSDYDEESWKNDADLYTGEIFTCINSGVSAWLDWNILLDAKGGPAQQNNNVKAPIILNEKGDDFILTPIYMRLKDIARMIPAGSEILKCECDDKRMSGRRPSGIVAVAVRARGKVRVVVANLSNETVMVRVGEKEIELPIHGIQKMAI